MKSKKLKVAIEEAEVLSESRNSTCSDEVNLPAPDCADAPQLPVQKRHQLAINWDNVTHIDHIKVLLKGMGIQVFYLGDSMPDNVKEMYDTGILKAVES